MIVAGGSSTPPQAMLAKELKFIERFKARARNRIIAAVARLSQPTRVI